MQLHSSLQQPAATAQTGAAQRHKSGPFPGGGRRATTNPWRFSPSVWHPECLLAYAVWKFGWLGRTSTGGSLLFIYTYILVCFSAMTVLLNARFLYISPRWPTIIVSLNEVYFIFKRYSFRSLIPISLTILLSIEFEPAGTSAQIRTLSKNL